MRPFWGVLAGLSRVVFALSGPFVPVFRACIFFEGGRQVPKNLIEYKKSAEAQQWIRDESAEQDKRYQQIVKEMDDLSEERDIWVEKFFGRIQTRGFNVHYNNRRQIPDDEIPTRPDRPFKVVF